MLDTIDFARFGKKSDATFHGVVSFVPAFYLGTFLVNGLVGIFLAHTVPAEGPVSEASVVFAVVGLMGFAGVVLIWVSQTRINTANFCLASTNLEAFCARVFKLKLTRTAWVVIAGALVYLMMFTDVLSWMLTALQWQVVFVVAWVGVALTRILLADDDRDGLPEFRPGRLRLVTPGIAAWLVAAVTGIAILERAGTFGATWSSPITLVVSVVGYLVALRLPNHTLLPRTTHATRSTTSGTFGLAATCATSRTSPSRWTVTRAPTDRRSVPDAPRRARTPTRRHARKRTHSVRERRQNWRPNKYE